MYNDRRTSIVGHTQYGRKGVRYEYASEKHFPTHSDDHFSHLKHHLLTFTLNRVKKRYIVDQVSFEIWYRSRGFL